MEVELEVEVVPTDFSERCELLPAGDERAGATQSVTLAGDLHVVDDGLQSEEKISIMCQISQQI